MSKPKVDRQDGIRLDQLLKGRGFLKGKYIRMPDRKIRAVCQAFPSRFISTQAGYCRMAEASVEQIENAIADLRSRSRKLATRADLHEQALNARRQRRLCP